MTNKLPQKLYKKFINPQNSYEQTAQKVFNLLVENFFETYFVGGAIRDLILGKSISDIDITTTAKPDEVIKILKTAGMKLDLKGKQFGVVSVKWKQKAVEIATMRKEIYDRSRFPKTSFIKSKAQDSKRRDFTINSLYFEPKTNTLYDPHGGLQDIATKTVRLIGQADKRLREDPLRIVRAYRFAHELSFYFDKITEQALRNNLPLLNNISLTRIKTEIGKSKNISTKKYLAKTFQKLLQK